MTNELTAILAEIRELAQRAGVALPASDTDLVAALKRVIPAAEAARR